MESNGNIRGPGHASVWVDNYKEVIAFHYYDKNRERLPNHGEYKLKWVDGWPKIEF